MPQPRKLHDKFFLQAKAEGYAARSAYKLKEIVQRKQILRKGDRVLDLGCAPGSWVQVAAEIVGPKGRVIGIDLKPVDIKVPANARTAVGDAFKVTAADMHAMLETGELPPTSITAAPAAPSSSPPLDAVISDMAPNTEGGAGGSGDHFRSVDLCRRVLELAQSLLKPGGNLVMKVFEGESYPDLLRDTARLFQECKGFKPEASRDVSREMFIVAKGFKAPQPRGTRVQHVLEQPPPRTEPAP